MKNLNKNVLGISGVARVGKDTFATILENILLSRGQSVCKLALAEPLKKHCDSFTRHNLNISAFTTDPEKKTLIRPFLVWYGDVQRKRTGGRYWVDIANRVIDNTQFDYYIITDIRYDVYENDELSWLKCERGGKLCHIRRYSEVYDPTSACLVKKYIEPANEHERENDPKITKAANYRVEWRDVSRVASGVELFVNSELVGHVRGFLDACNI